MNWIILVGLSMSYYFTISQQMTYESFDVVLKKLEALTARPDAEGATLAAEIPKQEEQE